MVVLAGTFALASHLDSVLRDYELVSGILSLGLWNQIISALGGGNPLAGSARPADVPAVPLYLATAVFSLSAWLAGAAWISRRRGIPFSKALCVWGRWGWMWWLLPVLWEMFGMASDLAKSESLHMFWGETLAVCDSLLWAGWLTTFFALARPSAPVIEGERAARVPAVVWAGIAMYFVCFAAMNWLLYEGLLIPHGDSAMYEEHLWNLLHGKGFRSYLDNGRLFLGEHIQVIHLMAIPLYLIWPSHVLLELCQSACLALGAVPVYRLALRHSDSTRAASLLAASYLLYFPLQFLDIAVTLKTFRPNSFEVPLLLCAIDALERGRYRTLLVWLGLALTCQEDAATVIAPLGIWIAFRQARFAKAGDRTARRRLAWLGAGLALFGALYLLLAIKVILPWFRGGEDVHFARYFADFGDSSSEIATHVLTHPGDLLRKLFGVESWAFGLALLAPIGFLPLLSPGRLAVGAPLFVVLCLSPITNNPLHHFHAALVPIVFWSAAAGIGNAPRIYMACAARLGRRREDATPAGKEVHRIPPENFSPTGKTLPAGAASSRPRPAPQRVASPGGFATSAATWGALCAFFMGLLNVNTLSPLGIGFWDPHSRAYWKKLYVPGDRAARFPAAFEQVPRESRVASTDYIHPRFTHHARSYDYSHYRPNVPDDAEYIVIDTQHPFSDIKRPEQVKEYREHPDEWELLEDHTQGDFIVLKRRHAPRP